MIGKGLNIKSPRFRARLLCRKHEHEAVVFLQMTASSYPYSFFATRKLSNAMSFNVMRNLGDLGSTSTIPFCLTDVPQVNVDLCKEPN